MVTGFEFEADARNFALLQSLYMNVDIFFSVLQKYRRNDLCATKFPARRQHSMLHVFHDNQTKRANILIL